MIETTTRRTWTVRYTSDGGDWPDFTDYGDKAMYRPTTLDVTIIAQPGTSPEIYHADVHGTRVRADGTLGISCTTRGWHGPYVTDPDAPIKPPAWITDLATRALASVAAAPANEEISR